MEQNCRNTTDAGKWAEPGSRESTGSNMNHGERAIVGEKRPVRSLRKQLGWVWHSERVCGEQRSWDRDQGVW